VAAPAWVQSSAGLEDTAGAWTQSLAGVTVGNVIVGQVLADGDTTGATQTLGTCTNIEDLAGTDSTMTALAPQPVGAGGEAHQYVWIGRAIGTTVTFAGTTAGNDVYLQFHEFSGVNTGTAITDVIENTTAGNFVNGVASTAAVTDTAVVTTAADRLAVNLVGVNDDNAGGSFTGETGGDWAMVASFAALAGTDGAVWLQTATIAAAGTIDGGAFTMAAADPWGNVGFALIPASSAQSKTITTATETDTAQPLRRPKLIPATETDTAVALTVTKPILKTLTVVAETDTAVALTFSQGAPIEVTLVAAAETDTAQALTRYKALAVIPATETDVAQALNIDKALTLTAATGTDAAQTLAKFKSVTLTPGAETDTAAVLDIAAAVVVTPTRTLMGVGT
jgi:hypothetical protein